VSVFNKIAVERLRKENMTRSIGKHVIADYYDCNRMIIDDLEKIQLIMRQAATDSGATVLDSKFHRFSPCGVSGIFLISESHLAIHTWPEYCYVAFDLFTCGSKIDPTRCLKMLEKNFEAERVSISEIDRGIGIDLFEE
jgi:S-adenosylmethionine decarboxylase